MILKLALTGAIVLACAAHGHAGSPSVRTDHHVHVHSPEILAYLPDYCASPGRTSPCDSAFTRPLTIDNLLADMDRAGVRRALLMSTGYLAESPMMAPARPDAADLVHAANAFTVDQARTHPDRLSAFIGVNPLTSTALSEISRWTDDPFASGVKLHLTNSGVDLRDPDHVARVAAVFEAAAGAGMAIMIHMRTRAPDYGARDVRIFIDQILPHAAGVPVIIAHSGGWGGLDANTWEAMDAFADALTARPDLRTDLYFDLAQTFDDQTPAGDLARLADVMRRIGIDAFLTGSDWPFAGDLDAYLNGALRRLPLTAEEATALGRREVGFSRQMHEAWVAGHHGPDGEPSPAS